MYQCPLPTRLLRLWFSHLLRLCTFFLLVEENHHPNDNYYRNLLGIGLWVVVRHGVVRTNFPVLGFIPEGSYNCSDCKQDRMCKPRIGLKALYEEL